MSKCFQNLSDLKLNIIVTKIVVGRGEPVVKKDVLGCDGQLTGTLQSDPAGQAPNADGGPGEEGC